MIGKVRIETGETNRLELDGVDISNSVMGFTVQFDVDHLPRVSLDMLGDPDIDLAFAEVLVAERCHDLLMKLGWTPPAVSSTPPFPAEVGRDDILGVL